MTANLRFYSENTDSLISQYDSVSFKSVHNDWLKLLPRSGNALDIGAGSGRDARYLSEQGLKVYAAEPALNLMTAAQEKSKKHDICWFQDALPNLKQTKLLNITFDLILLSAVWMHLSTSERTVSIENMASLLSLGGSLVITLRHGGFSDGRTAFPVNTEEVCALAEQNGLSVLLETALSEDRLGRDVVWQTVVLGK